MKESALKYIFTLVLADFCFCFLDFWGMFVEYLKHFCGVLLLTTLWGGREVKL